MEEFRVEFPFILPVGYLDADGIRHREGVMRRANAADEIVPLKDPRVMTNAAYLIVIILSRVVTSLGDVPMITPKVIENLYITDLNYLQTLYNRINTVETPVDVCPHCGKPFIAAGGQRGE